MALTCTLTQFDSLGDIHYSQDTIRDHFSDGRHISFLIVAFGKTSEPDIVCPMIFVAPYPDSNGGLYSLDNRRLFCMKHVYPPCKKVKVYRYDSIADYDREWDTKFSTVTQGQSIAVKAKGYKANLCGYEARHIPIPSECELDIEGLKRIHPFLTSVNVIPREPHGFNTSDLLEIRGRRCREVDMAGAGIYRSLWQHGVRVATSENSAVIVCSPTPAEQQPAPASVQEEKESARDPQEAEAEGLAEAYLTPEDSSANIGHDNGTGNDAQEVHSNFDSSLAFIGSLPSYVKFDTALLEN
jgi:hypothetical protein